MSQKSQYTKQYYIWVACGDKYWRVNDKSIPSLRMAAQMCESLNTLHLAGVRFTHPWTDCQIYIHCAEYQNVPPYKHNHTVLMQEYDCWVPADVTHETLVKGNAEYHSEKTVILCEKSNGEVVLLNTKPMSYDQSLEFMEDDQAYDWASLHQPTLAPEDGLRMVDLSTGRVWRDNGDGGWELLQVHEPTFDSLQNNMGDLEDDSE